MQIQVITDEGLGGAMKQLKHLKGLQEWIVGANQMVYAEAYSAAGLVEILESVVSRRKSFWFCSAQGGRSRRYWNGSQPCTR